MRLVKINDVILNMDNIAIIKGKEADSGKVNVYAYTANQEIWLGICNNREDYQKWANAIYGEFSDYFLGEIIATNDDEEEELWK